MLDILTMMVSMKLQSEVTAFRKETGTENDAQSEPSEPHILEVFFESAAATPLGEAVCQVASETVNALSMSGDDSNVVDSVFDLPTWNLTVPVAPAKA